AVRRLPGRHVEGGGPADDVVHVDVEREHWPGALTIRGGDVGNRDAQVCVDILPRLVVEHRVHPEVLTGLQRNGEAGWKLHRIGLRAPAEETLDRVVDELPAIEVDSDEMV